MSTNSRLSVSALVLAVGLIGCSDKQSSDAPPKVEENVPSSTTSIQRDVSTISLSESTVIFDDHEFKPSDGLRKLADYLGPPDRTSAEDSEEFWTWDKNGIAASGTTERIESVVVAFDPGGFRRHSPRSTFQGAVIVQGRGDLPAVTIDAGSDKELVSGARRLHYGFGATHDTDSGSLIDIHAGFITAERREKLNESPLMQLKYGDQESHVPEAAWNSLVPVLERGPDDLPPITSPGALTHKPLRKKRLDDLKHRLETKLAAQPDSPGLLHALGVAQYRCDEFEDAIRTLTSFDKTADSTDSVHPISVAVQAMAHHQLELPDEAKSLLSRARELLQQERWKGDERASLFVSEAEVLIEGRLPDSIDRVLDELIGKEKK